LIAPKFGGVAVAELVASSEGRPDDQFLSDLSAVVRLKSYLSGAGREIPKEVSKGIADVLSAFERDLRVYELQVRYDEWKKSWWRKIPMMNSVPDDVVAMYDAEKQLYLEDAIAMRLRDALRNL
jgi:hypothetical protein